MQLIMCFKDLSSQKFWPVSKMSRLFWSNL